MEIDFLIKRINDEYRITNIQITQLLLNARHFDEYVKIGSFPDSHDKEIGLFQPLIWRWKNTIDPLKELAEKRVFSDIRSYESILAVIYMAHRILYLAFNYELLYAYYESKRKEGESNKKDADDFQKVYNNIKTDVIIYWSKKIGGYYDVMQLTKKFSFDADTYKAIIMETAFEIENTIDRAVDLQGVLFEKTLINAAIAEALSQLIGIGLGKYLGKGIDKLSDSQTIQKLSQRLVDYLLKKLVNNGKLSKELANTFEEIIKKDLIASNDIPDNKKAVENIIGAIDKHYKHLNKFEKDLLKEVLEKNLEKNYAGKKLVYDLIQKTGWRSFVIMGLKKYALKRLLNLLEKHVGKDCLVRVELFGSRVGSTINDLYNKRKGNGPRPGSDLDVFIESNIARTTKAAVDKKIHQVKKIFEKEFKIEINIDHSPISEMYKGSIPGTQFYKFYEKGRHFDD